MAKTRKSMEKKTLNSPDDVRTFDKVGANRPRLAQLPWPG